MAGVSERGKAGRPAGRTRNPGNVFSVKARKLALLPAQTNDTRWLAGLGFVRRFGAGRRRTESRQAAENISAPGREIAMRRASACRIRRRWGHRRRISSARQQYQRRIFSRATRALLPAAHRCPVATTPREARPAAAYCRRASLKRDRCSVAFEIPFYTQLAGRSCLAQETFGVGLSVPPALIRSA